MCHFFETINCRNGQPHLLDQHQDRVNRTFAAHFPGQTPFLLAQLLGNAIPKDGWFKCRVSYGPKAENVAFIPYQLARHRSMEFVEAGELEYAFKSENRAFFEETVLRSACGDVLFTRNGFLTDSSYANVCLLQNGVWYTPEKPLLKGVKRQYLLDLGKLKEREIHRDHLADYEQIALINAMRDFELVYDFELSGDLLKLRLCQEIS